MLEESNDVRMIKILEHQNLLSHVLQEPLGELRGVHCLNDPLQALNQVKFSSEAFKQLEQGACCSLAHQVYHSKGPAA